MREKRERRQDVTPRVRKRELNWSQHTYSFYTQRGAQFFGKKAQLCEREREREIKELFFSSSSSYRPSSLLFG